MTTFHLPYGKSTQSLSIEQEHLAGVLENRLGQYKVGKDPKTLVLDSLRSPVGTKPLRELAADKKRIVIISSDHTRPVPSSLIMPLILKEIRAGNPDADITILIATGLHRKTSSEELKQKFGEEIFNHETIKIHDCDDEETLVDLGKLPSGGRLLINRLAYEADLLIAEGFIEPHFFAGFSGGRKSILPGIAGRESVLFNHNAHLINDIYSRTGILENNLIHRDMCFAATKSHLDFIVNVVIDSKHLPIFATSGDPIKAHEIGCEFLRSYAEVKAIPCDIAVSTNGGYPLDQNIYQAVKGMTAAEACVRENGIIIMLSECSDGHGGLNFLEHFRKFSTCDDMLHEFLSTKSEETKIDQWQSQIFARVLKKARVIFVSSCDDQLVRDFHMIPAKNAEEALKIAVNLLKKEKYQTTVIPDGVSVIVR